VSADVPYGVARIGDRAIDLGALDLPVRC